MSGNILKDTKYRGLLEGATMKLVAPWHPRHHGIAMQAHHAISAEGAKRSKVGEKLMQLGYNINRLPNLVFIPSTLQGACHLGVQPHRGDHRAPIMGEVDDDDNKEMSEYHDMVARRLLRLVRSLACPGSSLDAGEAGRNAVNDLSRKIVSAIQNHPGRAPLTSVAKHFAPGTAAGCSGVDSIPLHGQNGCPVERNHEGQHGPAQRDEQITYKKAGPYVLQVER